ncbi:hypothetical protein P154DRAFT_580134 [Amniculicola lignicola CBS 123094]|uniref:Uncharacterized protein n=1 Tax=Amniculicola lignicola CBS 123094 TaxID=1392246 RepID=A0A6A5WEX3_9PLEO|nr:hypothetical protein P154DRAFT_580134 [Amniculicola lignicola CBS 123094]
MRRVYKPTGFVACREADFPYRWYPHLHGLQLSDKYIYDSVIQPSTIPRPGSPPHPPNTRTGSMIHVWMREAGFDVEKVVKGAGTEVHPSKEARRRWVDAGIGRLVDEGVRKRYVDLGATGEALEFVVRDLER